ncbi:MAG: Crp/Fnr family transcriptional regulator [Aureispira sp.]
MSKDLTKVQAFIQQFLPLTSQEWDALAGLFTFQQYAKKAYLVQEGVYAQQFAFVQQGVLRAFYRNTKGEEYNKTFFVEGDFVGALSSLVTQSPTAIPIQCLTSCDLLVANYKDFTALFDRYPKMERLARLLAEQYFVRKEQREIELVTLEAKERYPIFQEAYPTLEQLIPQYHIASYLGISATQLSRIRAARLLK